jgi:hypothetical protein
MEPETKQIFAYRDQEKKVISSVYDYEVGDLQNGMLNFYNPEHPNSKPEVIQFKNGQPDFETYNCYLPVRDVDDSPSDKFKAEIEEMRKVIENLNSEIDVSSLKLEDGN